MDKDKIKAKIVELETAMGAAIECFEGARADYVAYGANRHVGEHHHFCGEFNEQG